MSKREGPYHNPESAARRFSFGMSESRSGCQGDGVVEDLLARGEAQLQILAFKV
jgi:hypothetical protein